MITLIIEIHELHNFAHMKKPSIWLESHCKIVLLAS